MVRALENGPGIGQRGVGVDQVGGGVNRATDLTRVTVLVFGVALGALALDVAIGQEHTLDRVKKLLDRSCLDQSFSTQLAVDVLGELMVFDGISRMPVVERDMKAIEVAGTLGSIARHQGLGRDALGLGLEHDGGAMGVICTDKMHGVASHAHGTHPDVGLDVLHDVADMKGAVGIGQGGRDKEGAGHG